MHVQKTIVSDTEVKLAITAVEEDLQPVKQQILAKLSKTVKVPGFRSGKVPPQIAEKHIDQSAFQTEFLDEAMTQLYAKATEQEEVRPVTQPSVDIKKFVPFSLLEFEVTSNVLGPVTVGKYKGLKLSPVQKQVTKTDVDNVIESLRSRSSERKAVERAAKKDDEVVMDFSGVDAKGAVIPGADGKDYPLVLGSGAFIPGFEDNLIGLKPGEEKTFTLTFPKEYGVKALASSKVTFTAKVGTVNEMKKPALDDAFAASVGPFKSVKELEADIKKQLEHDAFHENERARQNEAVAQVVSKSEVKLPQAVIDQQVIYELDELRRNLMNRGQTYQEFIAAEATTEDQYKKDVIEPRAIEQVKTGIVLSEIAELEKLSVTPEELEQQIQALKAQYKDPAMQAELDKPESRRDIASRILSQKVVNFIVENAV